MIDDILSSPTAAEALAAAQRLSASQRAALLDGTTITDDGSLELSPALEDLLGESLRDYHAALALLAAADRLSGVEVLYVFDVSSSLPDLGSLDWLPALRELTLSGFAGRDLGARPLTALTIADSPALTGLDGLRGLAHLERLTLSHCPALTDGAAIDSLPSLRSVALSGCAALDPGSLSGAYALAIAD